MVPMHISLRDFVQRQKKSPGVRKLSLDRCGRNHPTGHPLAEPHGDHVPQRGPTGDAVSVAALLKDLYGCDVSRLARDEEGLRVGDEMDVAIRMAGVCRVRVVHRDHNSITLATLRGHPEAGRITFGAYRNEIGDVIFHIRSRARSSTRTRYAGFLFGGEPMQTTTWTDFIDRLAHYAGDGIVGSIHAETIEISDEPDDPEIMRSPTFLATGD
jgi:hypothetical protein